MPTPLSRVLRATVVVVVLVAGLQVPAGAQPAGGAPRIILIASSNLPQHALAQVESVSGSLQADLQEQAPVVRVTAGRDLPYLTPADWLRAAPLVISFGPCPDTACELLVRFFVGTPPTRALLSPDLQTRIQNAQPITLRVGQVTNMETEDIVQAALALFDYATDDCPAALPLLGRPEFLPSDRMGNVSTLQFFEAVCLHDLQDYAGAINMLESHRTPVNQGRQFARLWNAYIADSYAQNFAFDNALRLDNGNITAARARHAAQNPTDDQMLAELYLLRGHHRLYQYEWNVVLEDYNRALEIPHAPASAYYYRGLLYYTQNERQAAYDDLTRFLNTEDSPDSPLAALAAQYVVELEALLATPQAK